ncbi:helix-turn-helix domain-containing protein [Pendulispora brunnea]|uniref:Helix-turn-helix domain-containing protein n=1 Tax=Pendulispora brunnea TaxID=2905690 RepID=A0ABZ2K7U6_9BACT
MHRLGFYVTPGFQALNFAALAAFELANSKQVHYDVHVLSETGGRVRTSMGVTIETQPLGAPEYDTVIISGAAVVSDCSTVIVPPPAALVAFLQGAMRTSRRIASLGTGAFSLADAGILDGRRATTHWCKSREFQSKYPKVNVEQDRIYIADGHVWTSAGGSASIDLALGMVEEDLGVELARSVAKGLVLYQRRTGGQSQHSVLLELEPKSDRMQDVLTYAKRNLHLRLSVEHLAKVAHLSPRQFARAFTKETGRPPAKAVEDLRIEAARTLMERTHHSLHDIAREAGFTGYEHMRRAFLRAFGQSPRAMRRQARRNVFQGDD